MNTGVISISTLLCVAPEIVQRAQRFDMAVRLIRQHIPENEVRQRVKDRFGCSRMTAWRTVEAAKDVA